MRRLVLSNTLNTRDLGGYPIKSGGYTSYNKLLRSDLPTLLTDEESFYLYKQRITTIIDLRSTSEIESKPSFFINRDGFNYHHCALYGDGKVPADEADIPISYLNMLYDSSTVFNTMKIIADTNEGVLYHCTAGKDRTGVISALLLSLAEVSLPDILADYQISYTYIRPMIDLLHRNDPSLPAWVGQSKPEYLSVFLSLFHKNYKAVTDYLTHIGLSPLDILNIKSKLCPP